MTTTIYMKSGLVFDTDEDGATIRGAVLTSRVVSCFATRRGNAYETKKNTLIFSREVEAVQS